MKPTQNLNRNIELIETAHTAYLNPIGDNEYPKLRIHDQFFAGRDPQCEILLKDNFISRKHAKFNFRNGQYYLEDLNSQNGTYVNDVRIKEVALEEGDKLRIGKSYFQFSKFENTSFKQSPLRSQNLLWSSQLQSLPQIANSDENILLQGESGTGKDVVSRYLHDCSPRAKMPFVSLNCSSFNQNLIESDLFGHTKGSFTDAQFDRKGAFLEANGGTLFLDEIGDMPLDLQAKLLRALENKEIRALGSDKTIQVDVRVIAATHRVLSELIKDGSFRADLYYRLNIIEIKVPPLRERMEDFTNLLLEFAREFRVNFHQTTIHELVKLNWPGNIRELRNFVRRSCALFPREVIHIDHLKALIREEASSPTSNTQNGKLPMVQKIERQLIEQSLSQYYGNQRRAAKSIGMAKSTFYDKVRRYNIDLSSYLPPMPD